MSGEVSINQQWLFNIFLTTNELATCQVKAFWTSVQPN